MPVKHVFEALLDSDLFGGPQSDSRAVAILLQQANKCVSTLVKLEMSEEGAVSAINRTLQSEPFASCESPIEKLMMAGLVFADWYPFLSIPAAVMPRGGAMPEGDLIIAPQFEFGRYRLDFMVFGKDELGNQKWVNVECDGDEFHNSTKAQWDADRERDKYLLGANIEVIRFSGSELYNDATGCAVEVVDEFLRWWWRGWSEREALAA